MKLGVVAGAGEVTDAAVDGLPLHDARIILDVEGVRLQPALAGRLIREGLAAEAAQRLRGEVAAPMMSS